MFNKLTKLTAMDIATVGFIGMMFAFALGTVILTVYGKEASQVWFAAGMSPFGVLAFSALMYNGYKTNWR